MHLSTSVSLLLVYFWDTDALRVVGLAAGDGDIFDRTEAQRLKHICLRLGVTVLIELAMCCWCLYLACDHRFKYAYSTLIVPSSGLGWRLTDEQLRQKNKLKLPRLATKPKRTKQGHMSSRKRANLCKLCLCSI